MRKKQLLLSSMLMFLGINMVQAQKVYTYVQQNDTKVDADGTAVFDLSSSPSVEFVDGKAVMTIDGNTVANLPMSDDGQLCVDFKSSTGAGTLPVTVTSPANYGTLYSPFELIVPAGVSVYAPTSVTTVNGEKVLVCNMQIEENSVIPAGTTLLLKNAGSYEFEITETASTVTPSSILQGTALSITVDENSVLTLGKANEEDSYGFYLYTGTNIPASKAYLDQSVAGAKKILFRFDDETDISGIDANFDTNRNGKYLANGHIVIIKNNHKYNVNGQEVK